MAVYSFALGRCYGSMAILGHVMAMGEEGGEEGAGEEEEEGEEGAVGAESVGDWEADELRKKGVMGDLGNLLPSDVIRDLGMVMDWQDVCCVLDEAEDAENHVELIKVKNKYHTEAKLRARALINLRQHGTPIVETYVEYGLGGDWDQRVRDWEWEKAREQVEEMKRRDPHLEFEWSWDVMEAAGIGTSSGSAME